MKSKINRREFLKTIAIGLGVTGLSATGLISVATQAPQVKLYELETTGKMDKKILIAYASRCGSTAEVAHMIAQTLLNHGISVDLNLVEHVKDLSPYKMVIIGSAIRTAHWLPEAVTFVKENRLVLRRISTAYFTVCLTMAQDDDSSRQKAERFLDAVREYNHADLEGYFGGLLDFKRLSWLDQMIMKSRGRTKEGDYRDWNAIQAWTDMIYERLIA